MDETLVVGRVARAHGNRGQVIVNPDTDFADDRFRTGNVLLVGPDRVPRRIEAVRFQGGRPIVALEGVTTMNEAEALAGAELAMPMAGLPPLPPGCFYRHDLVGCDVEDAAGRPLGTVRGVEGTLEASRLIVDGPRGEVLIPLVARICRDVDVARRRIVVEPPEGLIELNEARGGPRA